jgi:hypothetical protein
MILKTDLIGVLDMSKQRVQKNSRDLPDQNERSAYTMRQAHVEVRERHTGEITIEYKQRPLEYTIYQEQEQQQGKVIQSKLLQPAAARAAARPKQKRGPVPMSHPWRRFDFTENSMQARERRGELCILRK